MGSEIDLLRNYPKPQGRLTERTAITEDDRAVARRFAWEYFDGERRHGYGGFSYHPRFWSEVVKDLAAHYRLGSASTLLDIGCAKGFMLRDLLELLPGLDVVGLDVSEYALQHCDPVVRGRLVQGDARCLPFAGASFDVVTAVNSLHNLPIDGVRDALREIERVGRGRSFVMVDGWRTEDQRTKLEAWVLTAETMLHADDWVALFREVGYTGDYWFWSVD
jgi:SAM-dependent methyltransferase